MVGKKRLIKLFCALIISFLLLCFDGICRIQYQSIWSEGDLKPIWKYDTVRLVEGMWASQESLNREDKIKLYFALGSAKENRGSEKKYKLDESSFMVYPCIAFITDKWNGIDDISIVWEYDKNTLFVGADEEKATRYFIDEKHAKILHDLCKRYRCIPAGSQ